MRLTLCSSVLLTLTTIVLSGCDSGGGSNSAYVRVLNVSPGYDSVDLYVDDENDDDDGETRQLEAVAYETVSGYVELDSGEYTLLFKRSGVSGTLQTIAAQNLADDTHATYIAYGSSGNFNVLSIGEDVDEPDAGDTYVQVFNAAEAVGALDIYFTDPEDSLDNVSPNFAGVGSSGGTVDSGTYRLRITGSNDIEDIRLDVPEIVLNSEEVVSLILTSTVGGTLVNAMLLPQQGDLSTQKNTKARVRGAIGISNGTFATARIGGVTLLSNATVGAISSKYAQVDAGTVAVSVGVDGTTVAAPDQTLVAGGDYTLLVWNDAVGTQTTLISDDNRLPSISSKAKVRVINGMSGFGGPINLAIDYSPIAEGTPLGQASSFTEVSSGSDFQLNIASTDTAANLLTKTEIDLAASGVYTMFTAGGPSSDQVSGILRKDR
jgi:hypothetical protein